MGVGLNETTEEAKEALKARLEKIQAKVVTEKKVTPNNPSNPTGQTPEKAELIERMKYGDKAARSQVISALPGVEAMRKQAGWSE
jgi:aspartate/methionine/tyrosine aminotransferase